VLFFPYGKEDEKDTRDVFQNHLMHLKPTMAFVVRAVQTAYSPAK